jgi:hypothetical protein
VEKKLHACSRVCVFVYATTHIVTKSITEDMLSFWVPQTWVLPVGSYFGL